MSKNPWSKTNQPSDIIKKYGVGTVFIDREMDLIGATIKETCKEYKEAYKKGNKSKCQYLEEWFRSETFDLWTLGRINPDKLIEGLQDQVNKNKMRVDKNRLRKKVVQ